jgi:cytochrome c oxidase subunit 1
MVDVPEIGSSRHYLNVDYSISSWLFPRDHKRLAWLYLLAISFFAGMGGLLAVLLRLDLLTPERGMLADLYARLFTMHGLTMIYLFLIPAMLGVIGNFLIPLMIGADNMAFPRLNLFTFYLYLLGSVLSVVEASYGGSDTGWTFMAPYSTTFTPSRVLPSMGLMLIALLAMALVAFNIVVTVQRKRTKGLDWFRLPIFVWAYYVASVVILVGAPFMLIGVIALATQRAVHIGIWGSALNLSPLALANLFWLSSHAMVYIMILPALGIATEIIVTSAQRPLVGYKGVVHSLLAAAVLLVLSWGRHLFVGMEPSSLASILFSAFSFLLAAPLAVIILSLAATLRRGKIKCSAAMMLAYAVVAFLSITWAAGLVLSAPATAGLVHGTQFEWANLHLVMVGVITLSFLAAIHFWWPKLTGRVYWQRLAKLAAMATVLGILLAFMPGFVLGLAGMRARVNVYPEAYRLWNLIAFAGTALLGLGFTLPFIYFLGSFFSGKLRAEANPWQAPGLEWQAESPPAPQNFRIAPTLPQ